MESKPHTLIFILVLIVFSAFVALSLYLFPSPREAEPVNPTEATVSEASSDHPRIADFPSSEELQPGMDDDEQMEIQHLGEAAVFDMPVVTLTEEEKRQAAAEILNPRRVDPSTIEMPIEPVEDGVYIMGPEGLERVEE